MNTAELRNQIVAVVKELEKVEVRGQSNMASLLGSINYLNQIANNLAKCQEAMETTQEEA